MSITTKLASLAAGAALFLGVAASASAATPAPETPDFPQAFATSLAAPDASPPGVNLSSCRLTAAHPHPVLLVHGTFENMYDNWAGLGPILANDGYCVFALNYGDTTGTAIKGLGAVPASAQQVATALDTVYAKYHTTVDVVAHSQGGLLAEWVAKILHRSSEIHDEVLLSPTTHGTTLDGLTALAHVIPGANAFLATGCQSCVDQEVGSPVIQQLDNGPIAQPGVTYTVIESTIEEVVTPDDSSFIEEPGVTNENVQSFCPSDLTEHINLPWDNTAIRLTLNALDPEIATAPTCALSYPAPTVQQ